MSEINLSRKMEPELIDDAFSPLLLEAEELAFSLLFKKQEPGTIARKKIKGKTYVYLQIYKNGKYTYTYLGPEKDPRVVNFVENFWKNRLLINHLQKREKNFVKTLKKLKIIPVQGVMAKILSLLSQEGIISGKEGILIGTLAFFSYQIKLGFILSGKSAFMRTSDIDIARGEPVTLLAKTPVSLSRILEKLGEEFLPEGRVSEGFPLRLVHQKTGIKIEVIIPKKGKMEVVKPHKSGFSDIGGLALPYIDLLIENSAPAVILGENRLIPVYVPLPEYFVLHKLIVAGKIERHPLKLQKDLSQIYAILKTFYLRNELPVLENALNELKQSILKFKSTKKYFKKGAELLSHLPDIPEEIKNMLAT